MKQYTVKTGENIFDVAVTLSGTIEGIWDLLVSNDWLSVDTELEKGMVLNYHSDFVVRKEICQWLRNKGMAVKNGHHYGFSTDIGSLVREAVGVDGPEHEVIERSNKIENSYFQIMGWDDKDCSKNTGKMFWDGMLEPKIVIDQYGTFSGFSASLEDYGFILVDWGDNTGYHSYVISDSPYGQQVTYIEHDYEDSGRHVIKVYGMYGVKSLDFSELNGIYYVVSPISLSEGFVGNSASTPITDRLLLTKGQ